MVARGIQDFDIFQTLQTLAALEFINNFETQRSYKTIKNCREL